jgi:hypothetical protein
VVSIASFLLCAFSSGRLFFLWTLLLFFFPFRLRSVFEKGPLEFFSALGKTREALLYSRKGPLRVFPSLWEKLEGSWREFFSWEKLHDWEGGVFPMPGGRPAGEPGAKPSPQSLKARERLAICLAYLEASEKGASADLESLTRNNYASQLDYVLGSTADLYPDIDPWEDSVHRIGKSKEMYTFTVEESKLRRPLGNAGNVSMLDVFKHTRSDCVNIMLPMYKKLLNSDGGAPTGTEKDKIISTLQGDLLILATGTAPGTAASPQPEGQTGGDPNDVDVGPAQGGLGGMGAAAPAADGAEAGGKKRVSTPRVMLSFLTFLILGPLGKGHCQFSQPLPAGSSTALHSPKPIGQGDARRRVRN